jgi:hypothetical protein
MEKFGRQTLPQRDSLGFVLGGVLVSTTQGGGKGGYLLDGFIVLNDLLF